MTEELRIISITAVSLAVAAIVSFVSTPVVKAFAQKVGAIDVPKDSRRMHKVQIPRLGGHAIYFGFLLTVLVFANITTQMRGMLFGSIVIVVLGVIDDIMPLKALLKFCVQIVAALIAVLSGSVIQVISNPNVFSAQPYLPLGALSIPITVLWIVAITNSVNLIDGLDGLAVGVSTISSLTMLVIALAVSEGDTAILMAALAGGCIGFMPYNLNPAKIFMGDTGATFLGYVLAVVSIQGLFKFYAVISFAVPFLILGLPIFDTAFAFIRRLSKGKNPMAPDRSHVHHRLIDMGLNQKQAVAILYLISAILGLSAVVLTTSGAVKAMVFFVAVCVVGGVSARMLFVNGHKGEETQKSQVPSRKTEHLPQETQIPEDPAPFEQADTKSETAGGELPQGIPSGGEAGEQNSVFSGEAARQPKTGKAASEKKKDRKTFEERKNA
ncbi:MAG: MraY family glycosyltransferase [Oscillospiraceae bacterium]|nr:MraY family glycosyltransferase [Oscillospiraceae bacterium]